LYIEKDIDTKKLRTFYIGILRDIRFVLKEGLEVRKTWSFYLLIFAIFVISGCEIFPSANPYEGLDRMEKDDFHVQIHSDKAIYAIDEKIHFWGTLEYAGEADQVTIGHGSDYLRFEIEQIDGDLEFLGGMDFSYNHSKLEQGNKYITEYTKSGGYTSDDPNAKIYENFYSTSDIYLPPGEYKITGLASFECIKKDGIEIEPIEYQMPTILVIKVVEDEDSQNSGKS
jgi:hypothetical protein